MTAVRRNRVARLSATQRRHLAELKEIAAKNRGEAYWYPVGAEWRTATALADRGLLAQQYGYGMGGRCFAITDAGLEAVA